MVEPSDNQRLFRCTHCDFTVYFNVGASVSGICTRDNGDVLLLKRMRPPREGTWTLPGGFVEPGESGTATLQREIMEETGLTPRSPIPHSAFPNSYKYGGISYETFDLIYTCQVAGALSLDGTEVDAHCWFAPSELASIDLSFPSLRSAVDLYVSQLKIKTTTD